MEEVGGGGGVGIQRLCFIYSHYEGKHPRVLQAEVRVCMIKHTAPLPQPHSHSHVPLDPRDIPLGRWGCSCTAALPFPSTFFFQAPHVYKRLLAGVQLPE